MPLRRMPCPPPPPPLPPLSPVSHPSLLAPAPQFVLPGLRHTLTEPVPSVWNRNRSLICLLHICPTNPSPRRRHTASWSLSPPGPPCAPSSLHAPALCLRPCVCLRAVMPVPTLYPDPDDETTYACALHRHAGTHASSVLAIAAVEHDVLTCSSARNERADDTRAKASKGWEGRRAGGRGCQQQQLVSGEPRRGCGGGGWANPGAS